MMDVTATIVLESATGNDVLIQDVLSVTTNEHDCLSIAVENHADLIEYGKEWYVRDIYCGEQKDILKNRVDRIEKDDVIKYVEPQPDVTIQNATLGRVINKDEKSLSIETLPEGHQTEINQDNILVTKILDSY